MEQKTTPKPQSDSDEGCRGRPGLGGCLRPERAWISSLFGRFRALGYLYSQALFWVFFSSMFFGALHLQLAAVDSTVLQLQAKVVRNGKAGRT